MQQMEPRENKDTEIEMQLYDLHTHTNMSDADFSVEELIEVEQKQGHILGVSDHFFCCAQMDTFEYIMVTSNNYL